MTDKPLTVEQFGLSREDLNEIVTGSQTFLKSDLDPRDDEKFFPPTGPTVDIPKKPRTY